MYGGLKGKGADMAWYMTSLEVENAVMRNVPIAGGAVDLYKCSDQVVRGYSTLCPI